MDSKSNTFLAVSISAALLAACGGGSTGGAPTSAPASAPVSAPAAAPQSGTVAMLVSDASTEDWATIGVKVLSIALVPQGGGANVTVYTAPTPAPVINLAQLDQIAEILGNVSVPVGTYTGAVLTVSGNADDILLTVSANPEPGFAAAAGVTISTGQIQVQHTQGTGSSLTVPIDINLATPLVVTAAQNNALDLEFDLAHPAFIVAHVPPGSGSVVWAVDFDGPVRHHPLHDLSGLVLRHAYGNVTAIAADASAITILKEFPTEPAVSPETAVGGDQSLQILADATNGTLFYDLDAGTRSTIRNFSAEAALVGRYVRIAARYQQDGTLVATRIWAGSTFNAVWAGPEGHVLHVDAANDVITVANEAGRAVALNVDAATQFFFRRPQDAAADAAPIATGTAFIAAHDITRGFKVHATVVDPLATPLVAQSIDIETAAYDGAISAANAAGFTYTRTFGSAADDYVTTLDYISAATANGSDPVSGAAISGYKWWNFAYPTLLTSGAGAVSDYIAATGGSVDLGGTVGAVPSRGISFVTWNDPANPAGWAASASILTPSRLPLGTVAGVFANDAFPLSVPGGTLAATVDVDTAAGSATLVYQVDRTGGIVTVTRQDVTTGTGLAALTQGLTVGAPVRVYGVPQAGGTLRAYVLTYFTGDLPAQ